MAGDADLFPEPATLLLLRVALAREGDEAGARAAFAAWLAGDPPLDPRAMAPADRRLLPVVGAGLRRAGLSHPLLDRCDAFTAATRARNQQLFEVAAGAIASLHAAGIETVALKGLPLALGYYEDPALRPMTDVDLMVRPRDLERSLEVLAAAGLRGRPPILPGLRPYLNALDLTTGAVKLDLHQYLIEFGSAPDLERGLWDRSRPLDVPGVVDIGDVGGRAPAATDLLLHVCLACLKPGRHRNSRWIVDAAKVIGRGGVDWELLVDEARRRRTVLALRMCLTFLDRLLPGRVPAAALRAVARLRVGLEERVNLHTLTRYPGSWPELAREYWVRYRFGTRAAGRHGSPLSLVSFSALLMAQRWNLPGPWHVPAELAGRLLRWKRRP